MSTITKFFDDALKLIGFLLMSALVIALFVIAVVLVLAYWPIMLASMAVLVFAFVVYAFYEGSL